MDTTLGDSKLLITHFLPKSRERPSASSGVHKNETASEAIPLAISAVSLVPGRFALSQFRWESPECGLFRRRKDDPQTGGEKSSAEGGTVVLLISSIADAA
jgi:hypothetical protein